MSREIIRIGVVGTVSVNGVVNTNGRESHDGNDNHVGAKKVTVLQDAANPKSGFVTRDYTSQRCFRQSMFAPCVLRQATTKEAATTWVISIASLIGLLRGDMNTEASTTLTRSSPLAINDLETIGDLPVSFDQGSSTKPKEKGEGAKKDVSIFSRDTLGSRKQRLNMYINLQVLQFIDIGLGTARKAVTPAQEADYLVALAATLKSLGVNETPVIADYRLKTSVVPSIYRGVLLSKAAVAALVKKSIELVSDVAIMKTTGTLFTDVDALQVQVVFRENGITETQTMTVRELVALSLDSYRHFYELASPSEAAA